MKISNKEDLTKILEFYFSERFDGVKPQEDEKFKKQIKEAIKNVDGAISKIKDIAIHQLGEYCYHDSDFFEGNSRLILFIVECLSEEDRKDIIVKYLRKTVNNNEDEMVINTNILLSMLDYLPDGLKVNVLTNARPVDLAKIMGEVLKEEKKSFPFTNEKKYYKKHYETLRKVLDE